MPENFLENQSAQGNLFYFILAGKEIKQTTTAVCLIKLFKVYHYFENGLVSKADIINDKINSV